MSGAEVDKTAFGMNALAQILWGHRRLATFQGNTVVKYRRRLVSSIFD